MSKYFVEGQSGRVIHNESSLLGNGDLHVGFNLFYLYCWSCRVWNYDSFCDCCLSQDEESAAHENRKENSKDKGKNRLNLFPPHQQLFGHQKKWKLKNQSKSHYIQLGFLLLQPQTKKVKRIIVLHLLHYLPNNQRTIMLILPNILDRTHRCLRHVDENSSKCT